ncbi:trypsin alpha-3 isoform X1 [Folsomia candida]|uniref:Trypsin-1 n=1 Tax=Folsomia candida TaxID=158441 RepID=A0A226D5J2_FOLCA|nr:trypsin alpha-3 isoform X1 [Folsomia candida]OXA40118.1 Trypsin-1 [Folsomia candida]
MKVALVILGVVGVVLAGPALRQQPPERIVGGTEATRGEFPWIVTIQVGSHICGGSIVNANWIVTAAHCADYAANRYTIIGGEHNLNTNQGSEQSRTVAQIIKHPSYNPSTYANDIALMRLSSPFTFGTYVRAANLPASGAGVSGNLVVCGWGTTSQGGSLSALLLKVTVPFVNTATCQQAYGSQIVPGMICAGTGGRDSCQGDSGGPLHSGTTLVGIVSWGYGCAVAGYPGVYASVPYYRNWISQHTGT